MAQMNLKNIKKIEKTKNFIHKKALTTYSIFEEGGLKYLQIDMYGSEDREMPEKVSQVVQFDKEAAQYLVSLLVREFVLD
ncbi:MAG: methionyl-tRNA formyltransferase [Chloroflexota bacterium]